MLNGINKYRKFLCKQNIFCVTDDPDLFTNFEKNLKLYLPSNIQKTATPSQIQELIKIVREFYFGNQTASYETITGYIDVCITL